MPAGAPARDLVAARPPAMRVNAHLKVPCLVAAWRRADSIDDMGLLRHGAMAACSAVRAPSTLGSHLRSYTWERRPLEKAAGVPAGWRGGAAAARREPWRSSTSSRAEARYGHQKQAPGSGHEDPGIAAGPASALPQCRTPLSARFRRHGLRGGTPSARGAASLAAGPRHARTRLHRDDHRPGRLRVYNAAVSALSAPTARGLRHRPLRGSAPRRRLGVTPGPLFIRARSGRPAGA